MLKRAESLRKAPSIRYRCPGCSSKHAGFPALAYGLPDAIFALTPEERADRADVSTDLCVMDGARFFIRCVLSLPVHGYEQSFDFGPWVEVEAADFARYAVHFVAPPGSVRTLPGALANDLPLFVGTDGLPCVLAYGMDPDDRPHVTIVDADHPLARQQRSGVPLSRATELVSTMKGFVMLME
ncbi:MAG: DUF2199 domain-containing protein [Hyphomicrobiaceae bacterium]